MKVYIGPYKTWFGPYQFMDMFKFIIPSKNIRDSIADKLPMFPFMLFKMFSKKRKVVVKLHNYDSWGIDSTLAYIIAPLLKQLKETKHGYPAVISYHEDENGDDDAWNELNEKAWDEIMEKMIWAFEQVNVDWEEQYHHGKSDYKLVKINNDSDHYTLQRGPNHTLVIDNEGIKKHREKMQEGFDLFGKYYTQLWD